MNNPVGSYSPSDGILITKTETSARIEIKKPEGKLGENTIVTINARNEQELNSLLKKVMGSREAISNLDMTKTGPIHLHEFIILKDEKFTTEELEKKSHVEGKKKGIFTSVCQLVKKLGIPVPPKSKSNTPLQPLQQQANNETSAKIDLTSSKKDEVNQKRTKLPHTKHTEPTHSNNSSVRSHSATTAPSSAASPTTPTDKRSVENPPTRDRSGGKFPKSKRPRKIEVPSSPLATQETQLKFAKKKSSLKEKTDKKEKKL